MERGSDKHSPRIDDGLAHDTRPLTQGAPMESRADEARQQEGAADDEPTTDALLTGDLHPGQRQDDLLDHDEAEARAEHQEAKDLILALEGMEPGSDDFVTTMTKLKTSVLHHVDEEENVFFPKMVKALPDTAPLLGNDLAARRVEVEKQVRADREVGMSPSTTNQKNVTSPEAGW